MSEIYIQNTQLDRVLDGAVHHASQGLTSEVILPFDPIPGMLAEQALRLSRQAHELGRYAEPTTCAKNLVQSMLGLALRLDTQ